MGFLEMFAAPEQKPNLDTSIQHAKGNAILRQDFLSLQLRERDLKRQYSEGSIDAQEYQNGIRLIYAGPATMFFGTITEYAACLRKTMKDEDVREIMAHENAHANRALALKCKGVQYGLLVIRDGVADKYAGFPFVTISLPDDISKERRKKVLSEILTAPDMMSPHDEMSLRLLTL